MQDAGIYEQEMEIWDKLVKNCCFIVQDIITLTGQRGSVGIVKQVSLIEHDDIRLLIIYLYDLLL